MALISDMKTGSGARLGVEEKRLLAFEEVFGKLVLFFRERQAYSFCSVWEVLIILSGKCFVFRCLSQRKGLGSQK